MKKTRFESRVNLSIEFKAGIQRNINLTVVSIIVKGILCFLNTVTGKKVKVKRKEEVPGSTPGALHT